MSKEATLGAGNMDYMDQLRDHLGNGDLHMERAERLVEKAGDPYSVTAYATMAMARYMAFNACLNLELMERTAPAPLLTNEEAVDALVKIEKMGRALEHTVVVGRGQPHKKSSEPAKLVGLVCLSSLLSPDSIVGRKWYAVADSGEEWYRNGARSKISRRFFMFRHRT